MNLAPIVLFTYNRLEHLQKTVDYLQKNSLASESILYVYSDFAKNEADKPVIAQIRKYLNTIQGFKEVNIIIRKENFGLAKNIIEGVTEVLKKHKKVIVLEDDMICAEDFLDYMNQALDFYANQDNIFSLSAYTFPLPSLDNYPDDVYLSYRTSSWGWGTWLDKWQKADWQVVDFQDFIKNKNQRKEFEKAGKDLSIMLLKQQKGLINSWAVRWAYAHYKHHAKAVYLRKSKIYNIGNDGSGTHSPNTEKYSASLHKGNFEFKKNLEIDNQLMQELQDFFKPSLIRKIINWFKFRVF